MTFRGQRWSVDPRSHSRCRMASIQKLPNGKRRARYRDASGREHARHFDRKVDAQRWLDEVTASIVTGQYVDPNAGRITFREYAEQWRAAQVHRPNSQAHVETMLRRHAYPTFGDRPLASILPSEVQVWVRRLSDGEVGRKPLAPATVAVLHSVVSSIMKAAVRDRRIPSNPCEGTRLPRKERRQVVPPTTEQVELLADRSSRAAGTGDVRGRHRCAPGRGDGTDARPGRPRAPRGTHRTAADPGGGRAAGVRSAEDRGEPSDRPAAGRGGRGICAARRGPPAYATTSSSPSTVRRSVVRRSDIGGDRWPRPLAPSGTGLHSLRHYYASLLIRHGEV